MRSNIYKEARIGIYILAITLFIAMLFYLFTSIFTSMGYKAFQKSKEVNQTDSSLSNYVIVIDPGHGGEDPGASGNGLTEKDLNLDISLTLNELLNAAGYTTVLTRQTDVLLYNTGEENRKKYHDLKNREAIAEKYGNAIFISVHMNKFPAEYCKGLQTFYSENSQESILLAESLQSNAKLLQPDNKRAIKSGNETIYLLKNLDIPSVLVECGFLSNTEEANLLSGNDYRNALSLTLYCGIVEYLENNYEK